MGLTVLRPDAGLSLPVQQQRVIGIQGHWGQDPGALQGANGVPIVPVAEYGYDDTVKLWLPQPPDKGAAIVAAVSPDNRLKALTVDLSVAHTDTALGLPGGGTLARTLAVLNLTGSASIRLVNTGGTFPTLPDPAMDIFPMDRWFFDFTDVLLTNTAQPGASLTLYAGWRV